MTVIDYDETRRFEMRLDDVSMETGVLRQMLEEVMDIVNLFFTTGTGIRRVHLKFL